MSVYFAKVDRYIKVGYSDSPQRRVLKLWQSGTRYNRPWDCPLAVPELLLVIEDGDLGTERRCHEALYDYAVGLEFFIDEPGVRDFMQLAPDFFARDLYPFPVAVRPGGPFEPVPATAASEERRAEMNRWASRRVGRPIDIFGQGDATDADAAAVVFSGAFKGGAA